METVTFLDTINYVTDRAYRFHFCWLIYSCLACRVVNATPGKTEYFEAKRLALFSLIQYFGDITYCLIGGYQLH